MPVITPGERDYLSDLSLLKDTHKKNFIRENIKRLKQMEKKCRRDKKKSDTEMPCISKKTIGKSKSQSKLGRRRLIESKSSKSIVQLIPRSPTTQIELVEAGSKTNRYNRSKKGAKARGIQPEFENLQRGGGGGGGDEESSSEEDESFNINKKNIALSRGTSKSPGLSAQTDQSHVRSFSPFNIDDIKREMKAVQVKDVDYVKLNQLVQYKPKKYVKGGKTDPTKAPPTYQKGVLPRYLRDLKKDGVSSDDQMVVPIKEKENSQNIVSNMINASNRKSRSGRETPSCPTGHIQISDTERKQQLNEMRRHYAELINKLNRVPLHTDNQKARQMKSDLESEIENLESAISLFSKEKLFIKIA